MTNDDDLWNYTPEPDPGALCWWGTIITVITGLIAAGSHRWDVVIVCCVLVLVLRWIARLARAR